MERCQFPLSRTHDYIQKPHVYGGCPVLIIQNIIKISKKQPVQVSTFNLLTEVKALMILTILFITYFICRITDLFVLGAIFCSIAFLVYFRCKKRSYYAITIGMAVLIWAAFRFGLNVKF